jgi:putative hydroxymethylpyrimidine transport system substrate-binding protein
MKKLSILFLLLINITFSKPITVILDWFVNPDHAPLIVAQQQGFFKQQGLDVKLIAPSDSTDGPKLVAAGHADIAVTYQPQFMLDQHQGLPLQWIATMVNQPLDCLVALKNGPIKTLHDLKGKRIAHVAGFSTVILSAMLNHNGVKLNQVKQVAMSHDLTQGLMAGRIDAFTGAMRNIEPFEMQIAGKPPRLFYPEKNGVPPYDELILVVNKNEANTPNIKKFVVALQQGMNYLKQHPKKSWQAFDKAYPELNNQLNHLSWQASIPYFADNVTAFDQAKWQRFGVFLKEKGYL